MNRDVKRKSHVIYFEAHATQKRKIIYRENFDIFISIFWFLNRQRDYNLLLLTNYYYCRTTTT